MTLEELRKLQLLQIGAMITVDKICRENNLKYYMVKGTLIGAVRHKGFIPWDFDSDFAMYRDDYEKFLKISLPLIPPEYTLQHTAVDDRCDISFARILLNNAMIKKQSNRFQKLHLDIFVLDYMEKKSKVVDKLKEKLVLFLGYIHSYKINKWVLRGKNAWWKNSLIRIGNFLMRNYKSEDFDDLLKKITGYKEYKTEYTTNICSRYGYTNEEYKSEYFKETVEIDFEGYKFLAPIGYHEILNKTYGNYMAFPPENKRYPPYFEAAKVMFK